MILLDADKNILRVRATETVTSGSVQVYTVNFKFSSDWDGLIKTAVFRTAATSRSVVLDETNECTIPWEVLVKPSDIWDRQKLRLEVGVYGTKGEAIVLPTMWALLGTIQEGAEPGENAREPTPTVYEQLIVQLDEGRKLTQEADAQTKADADKVTQIAAELDGFAGQVRQDIQTEGNAQVERVTAEGNIQIAAAKEQADRAEDSAGSSANSAAASKEAQNRAETAAVRQPYPNPDTGTWWAWDVETGAYKDTLEPYNGNVMYATFDIDPATGKLHMITPDGYAGPQFAINLEGYLEVSING